MKMKIAWIGVLALGMLISYGPVILPEFHTKLSFTSYSLVLASFLLVVRDTKKRRAISEWRTFFRVFPESVPVLTAFGVLAAYIGLPPGFGPLPHVLVFLFIGCVCWAAALFFRLASFPVIKFLKRK